MESNKKIIHIIVFISILFLSIIIYLTYIQIFKAESISQNPYNKRQWAVEDKTIRGIIYDRNGIPLAETKILEDGRMERLYNYGPLYSHLIGYSSRQYGKAGLESYYNDELLGLTNDNTVAKIKGSITGDLIKGNSLQLTIDHKLQTRAEELLGNKTGSIVALNPKTGEVLAAVGKPDYDPNRLAEDWDDLVKNEKSPLLNRSFFGLYPPGSIYKLVVSAGVLENPGVNTDYNCTGTINIDGYQLSDANKRGHGPLDLRKALIVSCNTNFARLGVDLGSERLTNISKRFFMGRKLPGPIALAESRYPYSGSMKATDLAAVAIGQGKLLVSPLHMAALASTFANEGLMPSPHLVSKVRDSSGTTLALVKHETNEIISKEIAGEIRDMMVAAVREGTGRRASIPGVQVAGKTGTAQNETGENHAWFVGFAPADEARIAVAVILESEGRSGGEAAAPIAREIIREGLKGVDR